MFALPVQASSQKAARDVVPARSLQQAIANRAMMQPAALVPGAAWDFGKIAVFAPDRTNRLAATSESKLTVGRAEDPLEREADRSAERVMRLSTPEISMAGVPPKLNRKCAVCEEEEKTIQRHVAVRSPEDEHATVYAPPIVQEVLASSGQPLEASTRAFMERRFDHDFSRVRIHCDGKSAESAQAVNARAFTVGEDVVFGAGRYVPGTADGKRLLAHELTHTIQQGAQPSIVQRDAGGAGTTNYIFDTFQITESDLTQPDIIARLNALDKAGLIEYRRNVADPAVKDYLTAMINKKGPLPPCTADQVKATNTQAEAGRIAGLAAVSQAVKALGTVVTPDVLCAFAGNFNTLGTDPQFRTRRLLVERRLQGLWSEMRTPSFACVPADDPVCSAELNTKNAENAAYVEGHKPPIKFCPFFREFSDDTTKQQAVVIHEFAHLVGSVDDAGGYAFNGLGAEIGTCDVGTKFKGQGDVLANNADSLAGFVMQLQLPSTQTSTAPGPSTQTGNPASTAPGSSTQTDTP